MIGNISNETVWRDQRGRYFRGAMYDSNEVLLRYSEIAISYLLSATGTDGYTYISRQIFPARSYRPRINIIHANANIASIISHKFSINLLVLNT